MNYIEQINGFWDKSRTDDLTAIDVSTYMSILDYCNSLGWMNPFICHWDIVCQRSKSSKNAFYKSVERLDELGYIKFEKGNRSTKQPKLTVLQLKNTEGTRKEYRGNTEGTPKEHEGNLYKQLNYKTIKLIEDNATLVDSKLEEWIKSETKEDDTNEELDILSFSVISHLNDKTSSNFKVTDKFKKSIGARMKDGHELEDFKKVIDSKCEEWLGDSKMKKYLRPSTLFGTKFDEYRGQIKTEKLIGGITNEQSRHMEVPDYNDLFKD